MNKLLRILAPVLALALLAVPAALADGEASAPLLGYYDGEVYINEFFGIAFDGTGWEYEPEDELMAENYLDAPLADDEAARAYVTRLGRDGDIYCDMTAYTPEGDAMLVGYVEYLTPAELRLAPSVEEHADMMVSILSESEDCDSAMRITGTFLGEECPGVRVYMTTRAYGAEISIVTDEYYIQRGSFLFTAVTMSYGGDALLPGLTALWVPYSAADRPAVSDAGVYGVIAGTTYTNDWFGIGFDPGADWTYAGADELAQLAGSSLDFAGALLDPESDGLQGPALEYDMMATSPDGAQTVYVGIVQLPQTMRMLVKAAGDNVAGLMLSAGGQGALDALSETDGVTADARLNTFRFLGGESDGLRLDVSVEMADYGLTLSFTQQELFLVKGDSILCVYLMNHTGDEASLAEMADMFYRLP